MSISETPLGVAMGPGLFVPPSSGERVRSGVRRFSVDEYHQMAEVGILRSGERVELLEGIVVMMSPIGAPHSTCVELMHRVFLRLLPPGWEVSAQRDVIVVDSVPQPDVCVFRGTLRDYATRKPEASDLGLIVEVSDTTLEKDRDEKLPIYAAAGIPEYWIANLIDRKLEVYRRPVAASGTSPARYESVDALHLDASVDVVLDGVKVGNVVVRDVLP